jgi:hypothetical protein
MSKWIFHNRIITWRHLFNPPALRIMFNSNILVYPAS